METLPIQHDLSISANAPWSTHLPVPGGRGVGWGDMAAGALLSLVRMVMAWSRTEQCGADNRKAKVPAHRRQAQIAQPAVQ